MTECEKRTLITWIITAISWGAIFTSITAFTFLYNIELREQESTTMFIAGVALGSIMLSAVASCVGIIREEIKKRKKCELSKE